MISPRLKPEAQLHRAVRRSVWRARQEQPQRALRWAGRGAQQEARRGRQAPALALVMTLAVVLLVSALLSEILFRNGLDNQALINLRQRLQARQLARTAFHALHTGLMLDEVLFFKGYDELSRLLEVSSIPLQDGLLVELEITPLDHHYNLNSLSNLQVDSDRDDALRQMFTATLTALTLPAPPEADPEAELPVVTEELAFELHAALRDFVDADDDVYSSVGASGAEQYDLPLELESVELQLANRPLYRLREIVLVRGVRESQIAWKDWKERFAVWGLTPSSSYLFGERVNVNLVDRETLTEFLRVRDLSSLELRDKALADIQKDIDLYAERAESIAEDLIPEAAPLDQEAQDPLAALLGQSERTVFTQETLNSRLKGLGLNEKVATYLFAFSNRFYRVNLLTEFGESQARLQAVVEVERNPDRSGKTFRVHFVSLL